MKNMKATTCNPLNSMTVKGSNGSSRSQLLNPSIGLPLERRDDKNLGQVGGNVEQIRRCVVENLILRLHQDRADETGQSGTSPPPCRRSSPSSMISSTSGRNCRAWRSGT